MEQGKCKAVGTDTNFFDRKLDVRPHGESCAHTARGEGG